MTEQTQDEVERRERARTVAAELSWAVREVNRVNSEVDQELARRLQLRPLDYAAMGHVMSAAHSVGPAELSARLGISTGSATELADRLEHAGHLERHRDPRDRRRVALQPTEPAVQRILAELGPLFASLDEWAADFTDAEQAVIARYLRGVAGRLRDYASRSRED